MEGSELVFPRRCGADKHDLQSVEDCVISAGKYRRCRLCARETSKAEKARAREAGESPNVVRVEHGNALRRYRQAQNKAKWLEKLGGKCAHCRYQGATSALDFDHIRREDKVHDISKLLAGTDDDAIAAEMVKCQILCANCHREKTQLEHTLSLESADPTTLARGNLIQVLWADVLEDPTGNPDSAKLAFRTTYGLFYEWKKDLTGTGHFLVTSNTIDDPETASQSGWTAFPEGMIRSIQLVRKTKPRPRK